MITAKNIILRHGVRNVINNISWHIQKNERWILFGLNGCGKTTLLSALAGYLGVNKGEIFVGDNQLLNTDTKKDWRKKTGFISASFFDRCYQAESVLDIVLSGLYGRLGLPSLQPDEVRKAKYILRLLDMDKKYHYPYNTLSSGQRQKVLFARALITNPEVLFLDEPFNGLDILGDLQAKALLRDWQSAGNRTAICVTHHCNEITLNYTHAALLKNGKFFVSGAIQDVFTSENMSRFLERDAAVSWENGQLVLRMTMPKERKEEHYG